MTRSASTNNTYVARQAGSWIDRGFGVFLLKPKGKAPLGSFHTHGHKDATTDRTTAKKWVTQYPTANYGVVPPEGVLVLDIDTRSNGDESLSRLVEEYGSLPDTLTVETSEHEGRRGLHIYLRAASVPTGKGELAPGVEYKVGPCGYLVGSGSIHPSGARYELGGSTEEMAEAPTWLREAIKAARRTSAPRQSGDADWLATIGQRHDTLTSISGHLCRAGYVTSDEIRGALLVLAPRFENTDGLLVGKIEKVAADASRKWATGLIVGGDGKPESEPTVAQALIRMMRSQYEFGVDQTGQPFAVSTSGPRIALPADSGVIRDGLMLDFLEHAGKPPTPTALNSAIGVLCAEARRKDRTRLSLRIARNGGKVALDLGVSTGHVVVITRKGWKVRESPPSWAHFKRTELTSAMPLPVRGGSLDTLRKVVNVTDESWPMLVAWMLCVLLDVPAPILTIMGEQGAGKSTLGRTLVHLLDPSPSPLRQLPANESDWSVAASGSLVVGIDNLSGISGWLSDAMCRAVTGEARVVRKLYTDSGLSVMAFRRALLLTSIDIGAIRGDLASRLLPIELRSPDGNARRSEEWLERKLAAVLPEATGALLDLASKVLANPVEVRELPRMADAAKVMAAVDAQLGTDALGAFLTAQDHLSDMVADSDPVAAAVESLLDGRSAWKGTHTKLLRELEIHRQGRPTRSWPGSSRVLSQRLRRLAPTLRAAKRIEITYRENARPKQIELRRLPE